MIEHILSALGLVLVIEGLVYALAPSFVEQMLEALKQMPNDSRRKAGLVIIAIGVFLVWLAQKF